MYKSVLNPLLFMYKSVFNLPFHCFNIESELWLKSSIIELVQSQGSTFQKSKKVTRRFKSCGVKSILSCYHVLALAMFLYPEPKQLNITVRVSGSALTLNSTSKAFLNKRKLTILYGLRVPIRIRETSSGPKHINNNAVLCACVSMHPPFLISSKSIAAPLTPKSSGRRVPLAFLLVESKQHSADT